MSIKKNFIYNSISGAMQYIVLLITLPYISRILGVENFGIVSFVDSTLNFFILFAAMGINIIGVREIANNKGDKLNLDLTFSSLSALYIIWNGIILLLYIISILCISQLSQYKLLFFIGIIKILASLFLFDWFYRGIENFKFITIRNVIVRIIYILLIFLLIKDQKDYILFFVLTTLTLLINAIINTIYVSSFVQFKIKGLNIKKYIKPYLTLGFSIILSSFYTTFNVIYLGFVSSNVEVGYYTVAMKVYIIVLAIFGAFTSVMLPRMSNLLANESTSAFYSLINKSFDLTLKILIPTSIFSIIFSPQLVLLIAGKDYARSILPMQLIFPAIILVGISQIIAYQLLVPLKKDKLILYASIIGAVVGLFLNIILVGKLYSLGSAIVLIASESIVTIYYLLTYKKYTTKSISKKHIFKTILANVPYVFLGLFIIKTINGNLTILFLGIITFIIYFFIYNIVISTDPFILKLTRQLTSKYLNIFSLFKR